MLLLLLLLFDDDSPLLLPACKPTASLAMSTKLLDMMGMDDFVVAALVVVVAAVVSCWLPFLVLLVENCDPADIIMKSRRASQ